MKPHKQLLQEMELAFFSPKLGSGLPVWLPNGLALRRRIEEHVRLLMSNDGYREVDSPHIGNLSLYEQSGHYPFYEASQFAPIKAGGGDEEAGWLLKPMNCPHHVAVYDMVPRSYRELPFRINEFGKVYRYESAGAVNGLLRARAFIQDDGHVFIEEDNLGAELQREIRLFNKILEPFLKHGLSQPSLRLSLRGDGEKYIGEPILWDKAEQHAREALIASNVPFDEAPGEAAFYGPKIDFSAKDQLGRSWQLGSIQVDFNLPQRFALRYRMSDGAEGVPVMIHRAALGSLERFIAILLEGCQGNLPIWVHPSPVAILPVGKDHLEYAAGIVEKLQLARVPAMVMKDNPLPGRIAQAEQQHIPQIWVVGGREIAAQSVCVRENGVSSARPLAEAICNLVHSRENFG